MHNIAHLLRSQASIQPRHPAVVFPAGRSNDGGRRHIAWRHLTFGELEEQSDRLAWGLREYGFRPGTTALLMIRPTLDFYALVFAVLKAGAVPVLIDPGMGWKGFLRCVKQVSPEAFIGIPAAHALRLCCRSAFRSIRLSVTMGSWRLWGGRTIPELLEHTCSKPFPIYEPQQPDELAAVLFTSGSTGPAKGVCYSHAIFAAQCRIVQQLCQIRPGEFDLACFPLFSLFSLANGATAVIPQMDAAAPASINPECVREALRQWPVSYSFGSPALWKHVADYCVKRDLPLEGLKRVFMSGAPVPKSTHAALRSLLDADAATYAPYGCTEALPIAVLDGATILDPAQQAEGVGKGTCVGRIIPEITAVVIPVTDAPLENADPAAMALPQGQIGELCVCGQCVTSHYYHRPDADRAAKIHSADGRLWHRVGDVGYFDAQNRFWFCGRKNHRVELPDGGTLFSIPAESYFNAMPGVARSALVGIGEGTRRHAAIVIEPQMGAHPSPQELLRQAAAVPALAAVKKVLIHSSPFPVDVRHNAKINREELARWASRQA